jgi:hypothetical protein
VAVLFDSEEWSKRPLAIDRDALPVTVLENVMKWQRVARVWMPSLRIEVDDVINDLSEQVHLAAKDVEQAAEPGQGADTGKAPNDVEFASIIPDIVPQPDQVDETVIESQEAYKTVTFEGVPQDPSYTVTNVARQVLEGVVDHEGPISAYNALKRTAKEFGVQRFTNTQLQKMWPLLGTRRYTEIADVVYLWPNGIDHTSWKAFRKSTLEQRKLEDITPYEVVNAMESVVRQSISISETELIRWTATFFGAKSLTEKVQSIVRPHLQWAIHEQKFHIEDGYLSLKNGD